MGLRKSAQSLKDNEKSSGILRVPLRRSAIHETKHFNPSLLPLSSPIHLPLRTITNVKSQQETTTSSSSQPTQLNNVKKKESQTPADNQVVGMEFMKTPMESPIVNQKNKSLMESLMDSSTIEVVEVATKNTENSFKDSDMLMSSKEKNEGEDTQKLLEELKREREELILKLEKIKKEEQILLEKIVHNVKQVDKIVLQDT